MLKNKVIQIIDELDRLYPDAKPALEFSSVFELLVAVILSAQCTDVRVNIVTRELFKKYNTAEQFAMLSVEELTPLVKTCGLGKQKANGIIQSSKRIVAEFNGIVPNDIKILQSLPSVGRKTANVVASVGYGVPAIAVDTHVFRVSNRIGLAKAENVLQTELQLQKAIPKDMWSHSHHLIIFHGRNVCKAQKPNCSECTLNSMCAYYKKSIKKNIKK